jgi:hypothetical protein
MRALVLRELELVAGGDLEEVVVEERRLPEGNLPMWDGCNINAADIYYGENLLGDLDEVVMEAAKMTEQEKSAYDYAAKRAEASLVAMEAAGVGIAAWVAAQSSAVMKGILAALGVIAGHEYLQRREAILEAMTAYEFHLDGMDGVYDGIVDEKYRHNI